MRRKITMTLSEDSIQAAIDQLNAYKNKLNDKAKQLRDRVAQIIAQYAQNGFTGAVVDDIMSVNGVPGDPKTGSVNVDVQDNGDVSLVVAHGEDAVFIEFGAGVYHNGAVGSSPHPRGQELGFTIGSLGPKGERKTWGYWADGNLYLTHGTPAGKPMYDATIEATAQIAAIAQEVFST